MKLIGGNESGIFVNQIMDSLTCTSGGKSLQTGMKLIEVSKSFSYLYKYVIGNRKMFYVSWDCSTRIDNIKETVCTAFSVKL